MGKKSTAKTAKAAKKAKAALKTERKEKKKVLKGGKNGRGGGEEESDDDLEGILEKMRKEWEASHTVTEELSTTAPSQRANATLTPCPSTAPSSPPALWMIGGEFFSPDGRAFFYSDVYRYTPEKDEWRKFVSPTCPGPRSAHAVVGMPGGTGGGGGGGRLWLFGGEFSSLHQTTFHHYRDFWYFDTTSHLWERIETKGPMPSARSGHRMAVWKHFVVLFGGFYDPGITTRYLNDLWVFDTQEYVWKQIEFKETDVKPSPRSGFSFLPTADGILLHGGYCKEYKRGQRPVGVMLEDTWFLRLSLPDSPTTSSTPAAAPTSSKKGPKASPTISIQAKWEKRKRPSDAFAPSVRSGCTMALWAAKGMGVMFGGVADEEKGEEGLDSVFYNDMYGYQISGKGRWVSMALKNPKKGAGKKKGSAKRGGDGDEESGPDEWSMEYREKVAKEKAEAEARAAAEAEAQAQLEDAMEGVTITPKDTTKDSGDAENVDPAKSVPMERYNAMLAVLKNTLYIYGGIIERGSKEYTLDDFYSIPLDKLDRFTCLQPRTVDVPVGEVESSSDEDDEDDDEEVDTDDYDEFDGNGMDVDDEEERPKKKQREEDVEMDEDGGADDESDEKRKKKKGKSKKAKGIAMEAEDESVSELRKKAAEFMNTANASEAAGRSEEDVLSTPLPGETLAVFYARSRVYWAQKAAITQSAQANTYHAHANRIDTHTGKELRRDGFELAQDRYEEYKPLLEEVERILAEAGLDKEEMKRVGAGVGGGKGESRNRR